MNLSTLKVGQSEVVIGAVGKVDLKSRKIVRWEKGDKKEISNVKPTPFDKDRAKELWSKKAIDGTIKHELMTDGEIAYVHAVWDAIPSGSSSWMTAFFEILNDRIPVSAETVRTPTTMGKAKEGEWAHRFEYDDKGILGLDLSAHTNEGYELVRLPPSLFGALVKTGLQKPHILEAVNLYEDGIWLFKVDAKHFDVRGNDLKDWFSRGLFGLRFDAGKMAIWFKEK